jgi:hypothetical protein
VQENVTELEQRVASMTRALRTGLTVIATLACSLTGLVALLSLHRAAREGSAGVGWETWVSAAAFVATLAWGLSGTAIMSALAGDSTTPSPRRPRDARVSATAGARARRPS